VKRWRSPSLQEQPLNREAPHQQWRPRPGPAGEPRHCGSLRRTASDPPRSPPTSTAQPADRQAQRPSRPGRVAPERQASDRRRHAVLRTDPLWRHPV